MRFLSCLGGSARRRLGSALHHDFLSCLGGSARKTPAGWLDPAFLSCLGGSAPRPAWHWQALAFLSCLGGSALEHIKINVLIVKELRWKKAVSPFLERYR